MAFPFGRLPRELIIEIFKVAMESADNIREYSTLPVTFASINRQMRSIAISTPDFWTTFSRISRDHLQYHLSHPSPTSSLPLCTQRDRKWYLRSGSMPVDLILDLHDRGRFLSALEYCKEQRQFFDTHQLVLSRWRSVRVFTDVWDVVLCVIERLSMLPYAPRLESLELVYTATWGTTLRLTRSIQDTRVSTLDVPPEDVTNHLTKLLTNLTHLEISSHQIELLYFLPSLRTILSANHRTLHTLILNRSCIRALDSDTNPNLDCIVLPELRRLGIGFHDADHCISLLAQFSTPRLRSLELRNFIAPTIDASLVLAYFVQREGDFMRHVERVTLRKIRAMPKAFDQFFEAMRNLSEVIMEVPAVSEFEALHIPMASLYASSSNRFWGDPKLEVPLQKSMDRTKRESDLLDSVSSSFGVRVCVKKVTVHPI